MRSASNNSTTTLVARNNTATSWIQQLCTNQGKIACLFPLFLMFSPKDFYRQRTKYDGRYCFTGVCLFTFRGGGYRHMADGVPHLADGGVPQGHPHRDWMVVPAPCWDWMVYSSLPDWMGISPTPSGLDEGTPPHPDGRSGIGSQNNYAVGGMPLAFTQEDFLVLDLLFGINSYSTTGTKWYLLPVEFPLITITITLSLFLPHLFKFLFNTKVIKTPKYPSTPWYILQFLKLPKLPPKIPQFWR